MIIAADPDRVVLAAAHDPHHRASFLLGQPTRAYQLGHRRAPCLKGQSHVDSRNRDQHT
jgi:hypothetical protein